VNRRFLLVASAAAIIALIAGVVLGLSLKRDDPAPVKTAKPFFIAKYQYIHRTKRKVDFRVSSGTLRGAPRWPVVVVSDKNSLLRPLQSWVITGSAPTGSLRILEGDPGSLLLRAKNGYTYSLKGLYATGDAIGADLYPLGKRLDPSHLPALSKLGVAVPVQYGKGNSRRAVVLVGLRHSWEPRIVGFLAGYSLSQPSPGLDRALLGPDNALYQIDASARRLRLVSKPLASRKPWLRDGRPLEKCIPWPGGARGTYYGCPGRIELVEPNGVRRVIYVEKDCTPANGYCLGGIGLEVVLPSPDGRTLLVQEGHYACGGEWKTSFLSADGGELEPTVPTGSFSDSWALGWIGGDSALVAAAAPGECGPPQSGIYLAYRDRPGHAYLVLATDSTDAVIWRR
jgi:hypothetical protein